MSTPSLPPRPPLAPEKPVNSRSFPRALSTPKLDSAFPLGLFASLLPSQTLVSQQSWATSLPGPWLRGEDGVGLGPFLQEVNARAQESLLKGTPSLYSARLSPVTGLGIRAPPQLVLCTWVAVTQQHPLPLVNVTSLSQEMASGLTCCTLMMVAPEMQETVP